MTSTIKDHEHMARVHMELFLSGERDLLPVVDAMGLIARHILDRDEQPPAR